MNRFFATALCALPFCSIACTSSDAQGTPPINLPRAAPPINANVPADAPALANAPAVQTEFDERGLVRLRYGGVTLTDIDVGGTEVFSVIDVHRLGTDGKIIRDGYGDPRRSWDDKSKTLTVAFPWGRVKCRYETLRDRLNLDVGVENDSPGTIAGLNIMPLGVKFDRFPAGFDGSTPHVNFNLDGPTVQTADFGRGRLTVVNRDVERPLAVGFTTTSETPKNFRYGVYIGSAPLWYQPDNWPKFTRPIAPGARDLYRISLRFSPASNAANSATNTSASPFGVGADVYRDFAAAHPMTLNWPDRRPIGALFLSSAGGHPAANPRGWFNNDEGVDTQSTGGRARFRAQLMRYAADSIAQLREAGAQGMVTWDIEGQEYPHSTSYIGDPRLVSRLAPEMEPLADEYFRAFTDAGFKVGLCIRPQQLKFDAEGQPDQKLVEGEAAILIDKIAYARKRWGATLFYVDSNGGPYDPSDAEIFRRVAAAEPSVLLMPEHQNAKYQAYSAPYNDLRFESSITSSEVKAIYPRAFSVMKGETAQLRERRAELVRAVKGGDILMFNAWYPTEELQLVKSIYKEAS